MKYRRRNSAILLLAFILSPWGPGAYGRTVAEEEVSTPAQAASAGGGSNDANTCPAAKNSPKAVTEYVKRLDAALDKIRAKAAETEGCVPTQPDPQPTPTGNGTPISAERLANKAVDRAQRFGENIMATINDAVTISNFDTTARYYVGLALDSDVPSYVQRDDAVIARQQQKIRDAYRTAYNRCQEEAVLPAGSIPGFGAMSLKAALDALLKNQIHLRNYYRMAVIEDTSGDKGEPFLLVDNDAQFREELKLNYARTGKEACRTEEDFWKRIDEAITRIGKLGGKIGEGIRDWEAAWAMLNNADSLAKQAPTSGRITISIGGDGISVGGGLTTSTRNALKYNNEPEALGIGTTLRNVGRKVSESFAAVENQYDRIKEQFKDPGNTERYAALLKAVESQRTENDPLVSDYQTLRTLVGKNNAVISENVTALIKMHQVLVSTEKTIRDAVPVAERVCNDQATGKGNCSYK